MPSFIHQDVMNLTVRLPITRSRIVFMNVAMWENYVTPW